MHVHQRGLSYFSMLFAMALGAAILMVGLKLYPLYVDQMTLMSIAEGFQDESELESLSETQVAKMYRLRMQTNSLDVPMEDHVFIYKEKDDSRFVFETDYERRVNVYKNIDVVVVFKDEFIIDY